MKRTIISLVVFASMFVVGGVPNAQAQHNQECSNASLQGAYGFKSAGFRVPAGTPIGVLGRFSFDGKGNFTDTFTTNFNGTVIRSEGFGTYTVNADCTGTILHQVGGTAPIDIVLVDGGNEFYQQVDFASFVEVFNVAKRQFRGEAEGNQ